MLRALFATVRCSPRCSSPPTLNMHLVVISKERVWQCETLAITVSQSTSFSWYAVITTIFLWLWLCQAFWAQAQSTLLLASFMVVRCHRLFLTSLSSLLWTVLKWSTVATSSLPTQRPFSSRQLMRMTFSWWRAWSSRTNVCWTTLTLFCCGHELCQPVLTNVGLPL